MCYVEKLNSAQPQLRGYITSKVYNKADVWDIAQNTNRVAWEKKSQYDESREFMAWILGIAMWQIRAYLKKSKRKREFATGVDCSRYLMDFHQESLENTPVSSRRKTESSEDCRQENSPRDYPSSLLIVTLSNVFPPELLQGDTESLRHKLCFNLTAREKTLFTLLASGSSAKSVANKLNLSRSAATTAKSRLITKLRKRLNLIRSDYEYDYQAV